MHRFNPERAYAEVFGIPGVSYQQNGCYFRRDGVFVEGDPDRERELTELKTKIADPELAEEVRDGLRERLGFIQDKPVAVSAPLPRVEAVGKPPSDDMRLAENKALKAQMEIYGQAWTGVSDARRYLAGKA